MNDNENCLEGLECPSCKSAGPFEIVATCVAVVTDDGVEDTRDFEWDPASSCTCQACGLVKTVADFNCVSA